MDEDSLAKLRLRCLDLAIGAGVRDAAEIVEWAREFEAYARSPAGPNIAGYGFVEDRAEVS